MKYPLFLLLFIWGCSTQPGKPTTEAHQHADHPHYKDGLFGNFTERNAPRDVIFALVNLDSAFEREFKLPKDPCQLDDNLDVVADSLFGFEEKRIEQMNQADKDKLITTIWRWLNNNQLLQAGEQLADTMPQVALLAQIPSVKHLIAKYLPHPEDPVSAFPPEQSCKLHYDLLHYLQQVSPEEQTAFYRQYFDMATRRDSVKKP
ncbi:hypothetical protein [Chitinophaga solisilvae]|uniref:Uncharacterized protein n=1 Tax=Chitinophaga solisilvae TaxID=1233460 RepID=A0A3S1DQM7_9BACT|nr:hypothetical protein [Chitinophaga solisilvae]NSL90934.1 hypothetical protein [Chitinophaga solisilvae]